MIHKAPNLRDQIDYMYQEKNEEEDSLALSIMYMHQFKASKNTLESTKMIYYISEEHQCHNEGKQ